MDQDSHLLFEAYKNIRLPKQIQEAPSTLFPTTVQMMSDPADEKWDCAPWVIDRLKITIARLLKTKKQFAKNPESLQNAGALEATVSSLYGLIEAIQNEYVDQYEHDSVHGKSANM